MKIADAHTHIFPTKIAEKATKSIGDFYEFEGMFSDASTDNLLTAEKNAGVSKILVCSSSVTADQTTSINNFIARECKKHEEFVGLGALHPYMENFCEEIDRISRLGLRGVKIHSDFQKIDIDDEKALPIYRELAKRKLPVLFHMGDNRYDYSSPIKLQNLMHKVPDLVVIAAHFGGYKRWEDAMKLEKSDNLFFDTSSSLFTLDKKIAVDMIEKFGADKFLYGTDFPMWNPKEEIERFLDLGLDDEDNKKILYDNFEKLFL